MTVVWLLMMGLRCGRWPCILYFIALIYFYYASIIQGVAQPTQTRTEP